jgi:UDP-GlcNAc:undecaprenyl-phosphate GlcNAc-1-phosphate transferase
MLNNPRLHLHPVGFVDDDYLKTGKKLQGYPILGTSEDLEALIETYKIRGVLVSFRNAASDDLPKAVNLCRRKEVFLRQFSICLEDVSIPVLPLKKNDRSDPTK